MCFTILQQFVFLLPGRHEDRVGGYVSGMRAVGGGLGVGHGLLVTQVPKRLLKPVLQGQSAPGFGCTDRRLKCPPKKGSARTTAARAFIIISTRRGMSKDTVDASAATDAVLGVAIKLRPPIANATELPHYKCRVVACAGTGCGTVLTPIAHEIV